MIDTKEIIDHVSDTDTEEMIEMRMMIDTERMMKEMINLFKMVK